MSAALIAMRDISKFFGAVTALDRVNLVLHRGEVLGVVGDNGVDKFGVENVLKAINGQTIEKRIDTGTVVVTKDNAADYAK